VTDAVAISAGGQQSLALKRDGTVVQWGQPFALVPSGLANVTAIASGTNFHLALLSNAAEVSWSASDFGQTTVPDGLSNVAALAAGGELALTLKRDGMVSRWGGSLANRTNPPAGSVLPPGFVDADEPLEHEQADRRDERSQTDDQPQHL